MILQLLEDAGGLENLVQSCAKRAPSLSLIGKLLPIDVKTPPSQSVRDLSREELVDRARALPAVALFLCGLVDAPATLARDPCQSLPSLPQGPSIAPAATPRAGISASAWRRE
jgi:hypothetical protein